jgi:hypothetical protein
MSAAAHCIRDFAGSAARGGSAFSVEEAPDDGGEGGDDDDDDGVATGGGPPEHAAPAARRTARRISITVTNSVAPVLCHAAATRVRQRELR